MKLILGLVVVLGLMMGAGQVQAVSPVLTVSPTSFPKDTPTLITFVGTGWTPGAQLIIGIEGETSTAMVDPVEADGSFIRTFTVSLPKQGGSYRAFARAQPMVGEAQQEAVQLHVTK